MSDLYLQNQRRERIYRYAPLVLWICLVFFLSSSQGSSSQTSQFFRPLLEFLFPRASEETLLSYHSYIRKCAHFFVYAALAFWCWRAVKDSSKELARRFKYLVPLALVLCVAALDEINQSYNAARTASIYDVALDFVGGLTMISVIYAATKYKSFND